METENQRFRYRYRSYRIKELNCFHVTFIGIPYALHEAGFGFGLLLLVVVAYVTDYSLILMVRCGHASGRFSYQGIMDASFGKPGYILLSILQFFYPFIGG